MRKTPLIGTCIDCQREMVIKARGRCGTCDEHWRKASGAYVPVRRRLGDRQWANEQTRAAWLADAPPVESAGDVRTLVGEATWADAERAAAAIRARKEPTC